MMQTPGHRGTKELNLAFEVLDPNLTYAAYAAPRPLSDHERGRTPQLRRFSSHPFAPLRSENPCKGAKFALLRPYGCQWG
jgi:hypothetical protein